MQIQIFDKNVALEPSQRQFILRRLEFAFDRFESKVRGLSLTLSDVNGPRGGKDKLCRLRMMLQENGEIVLSENSFTIEAAVARLADRAANTVHRLVERRRIYQRHAHSVVSGGEGAVSTTLAQTAAV